MKKLATLFAAAMLTVSVSAQTVQESKTFDNVYLGVNSHRRGDSARVPMGNDRTLKGSQAQRNHFARTEVGGYGAAQPAPAGEVSQDT